MDTGPRITAVSEEEPQSRWRPSRAQLLWAGGMIAVLAISVLIGYRYGITLWDWIKLLIVPAVIAAGIATGSVWFNRQQQVREMQIASQRAMDEALQAYLDQMSQLIADKERPLRRARPGDDLSTVARARTLTVLTRLDGERKRSVVQFLYESGLILRVRRVLDLRGADLSGVNLIRVVLIAINLYRANLSRAKLNGAHLEGADLSWANLKEAELPVAHMEKADLNGANLEGAKLQGADLSGSLIRSYGKMEIAVVVGEANLNRANLEGAWGITNRELAQQTSALEGATMPNGQKYEDWLKDREGRKEDAENK